MSTPPWRSASARRGAARRPVMSSCSAEPPIRLATAARSSPWAGTSRQTTCAPSRASTSAIAAPMPREAPVTSRDLAGERPVPVVRRVRTAGADADDLAGHVRRARRQQEPQRRLERRPPARRRRAARSRPARTSLAERADEALERALGDACRLGCSDACRAPRGRTAASARITGWKKSYSVAQVAGVGRCRSRRRPARRSRLRPSSAPATQLGRTTASTSPHRARPSRPAAAEQRRPVQHELPGSQRRSGAGWGRPRRRTMKPARGRVGELLVSVGHGSVHYPIETSDERERS